MRFPVPQAPCPWCENDTWYNSEATTTNGKKRVAVILCEMCHCGFERKKWHVWERVCEVEKEKGIAVPFQS